MKCKTCGRTIAVPKGEEPIKYIGKHNRKYHPEKFLRKNKTPKVKNQPSFKEAPAGAEDWIFCPMCGKRK